MNKQVTYSSLEERVEKLNSLFKEIAKDSLLLDEKIERAKIKTLLATSL